MRHILGEDLKIGSVLTWGPGWYFQKKFFEGKDNKVSTLDNRIRYDVEVSGFRPATPATCCLLRLEGGGLSRHQADRRLAELGTADPALGKEQGAVVGFAHSGWGLQSRSRSCPSYDMPPFDGIGANEYIVTVTHGLADFISTVDTPYAWELNIWYHTLNVGYRTRISGETDFPCIYGERVGLGRSYVRQTEARLRRLGAGHPRRPQLRLRRQEPPDRLPCERRRDGHRGST